MAVERAGRGRRILVGVIALMGAIGFGGPRAICQEATSSAADAAQADWDAGAPAPPPQPVPIPAQPPPATSHLVLGVGSRLVDLPEEGRVSPAVDLILGSESQNGDTLVVLSVLPGVHPAYAAAGRFQLFTGTGPFRFGLGLDFGLIDEPLDSPPLILEASFNPIYVAFQWKELYLQWRAFAVGGDLLLSDALPLRVTLESGLTVAWLP